MKTKGNYDFTTKAREYRRLSDSALRFAARDIRETLRVWRDHPNAGWYADDLHTVAAEANRRHLQGLL